MGRAHGVAGEVLVELTSDRTDRLQPGSVLESDRGPLTVLRARPHAQRWLVRFDGVGDRNQAELLRGLVLRAPAEPSSGDEPDDTLWVYEVIGLEVVDAQGVAHGRVVAVQPNPAHDLLVLDDDTLVPSVFITSVGEQIVVDVPEGIF